MFYRTLVDLHLPRLTLKSQYVKPFTLMRVTAQDHAGFMGGAVETFRSC